MKRLIAIVVLLGAASVGPLIFPAAEAGHSSMDVLARFALLPSVAIIFLALGLLHELDQSVAKLASVGVTAGAVATLGLEAVRLAGFRLGLMPGNLPRLMGVLLLNQFATGPTLTSDIAGWAYHFWNGASFGLIYVLVFGTCRRWVGSAFGVAVGLGFLFSPVVASLGVGFLGLSFSKGFPLTVILAHAIFGAILGWLTARWEGFVDSPLQAALADYIRNWVAASHSPRRAQPL